MSPALPFRSPVIDGCLPGGLGLARLHEVAPEAPGAKDRHRVPPGPPAQPSIPGRPTEGPERIGLESWRPDAAGIWEKGAVRFSPEPEIAAGFSDGPEGGGSFDHTREKALAPASKRT